MCGISGVVSRETSRLNIINLMTSKLKHRGPDNVSTWIDPFYPIALGHTRLSILDLREEANQPFNSYNKRWVITFNGEIYNHKEIRELINKDKNLKWKTSSDTETLVNAIEHFGLKKTLELVNGMYAIGAWDREEKKLFLVRDRIGEKPIYFCKIKHDFFFCSELKSIISLPEFKANINHQALRYFLKFGYLNDDNSIFEGINKLKPGFYLEYSNSRIKLQKYWDINHSINCENKNAINKKEYINDLESKLISSLKMRLNSDVPLGLFLSGGIDSTLLFVLMSKMELRDFSTFTIGFNNNLYDESYIAEKTSNYFKIKNNKIFLDKKSIINSIEMIPSIWDEPFADSSQIPTLAISDLAKDNVKVILSGDGGDELFLGYNRYNKGYDLYKRYINQNKIPKIIISFFLEYAKNISNPNSLKIISRILGQNITGDKIRKILEICNCKSDFEYYETTKSASQKSDEYLNNINFKNDIYSIENSSKDFIDSKKMMQVFDFLSYLPNDILTKLDRATMSKGIEARTPLLDHTLIEWVLSTELIKGKNKFPVKWAAKEIIAKYYPHYNFKVPKKGFGLPLGQLLKTDLRDWVDDIFSYNNLSKNKYLDTKKVITLWDNFKKNDSSQYSLLWNILIFQIWFMKNNYLFN